jgi:release factor glutamine methyltransferase
MSAFAFTPMPNTLADVLRQAPLDPLENRILICHALGLTRVQLFTHDQRVISHNEAQQLQDLFQRRLSGEPIAYIVGEREFFGLPFKVTPAVLIPRPDTELLVELAIARLPEHGHLLDLGTGSGAIALSIAHSRLDAAITAVDISSDAIHIAQQNAAQLLPPRPTPCRLLQSDWFSAVSGERFDLIVSNPPYIVAGDQHLTEGDLRFEPIGALTDHADGLSAYRTIITAAPHYLHPQAWLLLEHGYDQAVAVRKLLQDAGFEGVQSWKDLAGIERVSGAYVP